MNWPSFLTASGKAVSLSGISISFPMLSRTQGRLPTCYSPVRHFTNPPKGVFSFDLMY